MTTTIKQLQQGLAEKQFSSVEITQDYLNKINQQNAQINCFISVTDELALQQAADADTVLANGTGSVLTGIPIAHKDIFCTDGVKTSCGSKMLDNFIAPYNATVIEKFNQSGSVMLGKTNLDEFAMGSSNENSYYGSVANPWDSSRVPGGSSGGSAAAVAARLAPGATGTDTGGSIRQPAALCGITGIKPTYGRVSRYGIVAFGSSLDQAGPFAHTAEDCALLLQSMSGFDPRDSTSVDQAVPNFSDGLNNGIAGLKIGLPKEFFADG
ncbi:MAG: aspartyl-tRNA(Asn)/glutamyl-tRNA(Gln) amidotransferase subunit A, partial [Gammaproteobacteria bacterium]